MILETTMAARRKEKKKKTVASTKRKRRKGRSLQSEDGLRRDVTRARELLPMSRPSFGPTAETRQKAKRERERSQKKKGRGRAGSEKPERERRGKEREMRETSRQTIYKSGRKITTKSLTNWLSLTR